MWRKVSSVQMAGGVPTVQAAFVQLQKSAAECRSAIDMTEAVLKKEQEEDKVVRDRFQGKWARPQSEALTGPLKLQMKTYLDKLNIAIDTNRNVEMKVDAVKDRFPLVAKSRAELEQLMPEASAPSGGETPAAIALRARVEEVETAKAKAYGAVQQYKTLMLVDSSGMVGTLAEAHAAHVNLDSKIAEELGKYTAERAAAVAAFDAIGATLPALEAAEADYKRSQQHAPGPRVQWLQALDQAAETLKVAHSETNEGLSFFARLLEYTRQLSQQASDFVFARSEEKTGLLQQIQRTISGS